MQLQPRQLDHPVTIRLNDSSDEVVFRQIFVGEEFAPVLDLENVRKVIDLGANVGFTSALLLSRYPQAEVLAVEPDPDNYRQTMENLALFGRRVRVVHGAVWPVAAQLAVVKGGDGLEWGRQVCLANAAGEAGADTVKGWTMPELIEEMGGGPIDLLKIDIEGAERDLFAANASAWLGEVRNLTVELHGPECQDAFWRAMSEFDCQSAHSGELEICRNIRRRPGPGRALHSD